MVFSDGFSRITALTGYDPPDIIDRNLYHFCHASDLINLRYAHQQRK